MFMIRLRARQSQETDQVKAMDDQSLKHLPSLYHKKYYFLGNVAQSANIQLDSTIIQNS